MSHFVEISFLLDIVLIVEDGAEVLEHAWLVEQAPFDLVNHVRRAVYQSEIPFIETGEQTVAPKFAHHRLIFAQQTEIRHDRLDGNDEIAILVGTVECSLNALLEISKQIAGITAEYLVAALAAEHHLKVAGGQCRYHELRERARPGHGEIEMIEHLGDVVSEVLRGDVDHAQPRA